MVFFLHADDEDWNRSLVSDLGDGAAEKNVTEQPVTVSGHRNQIAMFTFGGFENFRRRIAERQHGFN